MHCGDESTVDEVLRSKMRCCVLIAEEVHDGLFRIIILWAHSGVPLFFKQRGSGKKDTMKDKTATRGTTYC